MTEVPFDPGSVRVTHERGPMTRQVHTAAVAEGGEALWETLLQRVSEPCRERFHQPVGYFEWVPLELAIELHGAWVDLKQHDPMTDRGEEAARDMLRGLQGWILRMASPSFLMANIQRMWAFYYRGGWVRVVQSEPGHATIELHAEGFPDTWYSHGVPGWLRVALELTGAKDVQTVHGTPEASQPAWCHRYAVRWRE